MCKTHDKEFGGPDQPLPIESLEVCAHPEIEPQLVCERCGHREEFKAPEWINFGARRPADGQECLIWWTEDAREDGQIDWARFEDDDPEDSAYFHTSFNHVRPVSGTIIFWRPLPDPPTPEQIARAKGPVIYDVKVIECVYDGSYIEHIIESPIDFDRNEIVGTLVRVHGVVYQIVRCNMSAIVHHRKGERIGVRLEEVNP